MDKLKIRKPKNDKEINWVAETKEELGSLFIRGYRKTQKKLKEAKEEIKRWINDKNFCVLIVCNYSDLNSIPIAMIISGLRKSPLDGVLECYIDSIYVKSTERNKGIGHKLMEKGYKWGKEKGAKRIKTFVSFTNMNMIKLCKTLGYVENFIEFEKKCDFR